MGHAGALGALYYSRKKSMKEGDAPMMIYLMHGEEFNVSDPTAEHWGGQFQLVSPSQPSFWSDIPPNAGNHATLGAESVSKWRVSFIDQWNQRLSWFTVHRKQKASLLI